MAGEGKRKGLRERLEDEGRRRGARRMTAKADEKQAVVDEVVEKMKRGGTPSDKRPI